MSLAYAVNDPVAKLAACVFRLSEKDQSFAHSLLQQAASRALSVKQMEWVNILVGRATKAKAAPVAKVEVGSVAGIIALFDKAKAAGKTRVAILFQTASGQTIRMTQSQAGEINVKTPGAYEDSKFFGRVTRDGHFEAHRPTRQPDDLLPALRAMASDPAGMAKLYGQATNHCCFCARELTHAHSIKAGYGPDCSALYGLPWGA